MLPTKGPNPRNQIIDPVYKSLACFKNAECPCAACSLQKLMFLFTALTFLARLCWTTTPVTIRIFWSRIDYHPPRETIQKISTHTTKTPNCVTRHLLTFKHGRFSKNLSQKKAPYYTSSSPLDVRVPSKKYDDLARTLESYSKVNPRGRKRKLDLEKAKEIKEILEVGPEAQYMTCYALG